MSRSLLPFVVWWTLYSVAPAVLSQTPVPGGYETRGGWGSLSITKENDGALAFEIGTMGANAHMCNLNGKIDGYIGYTEKVSETDSQCLITFKAVPNGLSVSTQTDKECRQYCGNNAWIEGDYFLPSSACNYKARKNRQESFMFSYRLREYKRAFETLNSYYAQCGEFLDYVALDRVRNDLAISLYHLGRKKECIAILRNTLGFAYATEEALNDRLFRPADFDRYLPVAEATWHNLKLCGKAPATKVFK